MKKIILILVFIFMYSFSYSFSNDPKLLYHRMGLEDKITYSTFERAIIGFKKIPKKNGDVITIIDYTKPSTQKRFYVLDLKREKILYETLVSHGKNSGINETVAFSDTPNSYQSTLGFFLTDKTYSGEFGYSLKLKGLEPGINANTEARKIVIHGASYVSEDFIKKNGFLGRTLGCPALPQKDTNRIIEIIKDGTVLFVSGDDPEYIFNTSFLR